ncbi:hypothetical protein E5288_WYG004512 [Bos mutus]|uniref:Uncharacterized protein n=1 Tax=Bos mutus TaxID=72004 RepID=A0A6B0RNT0_9CETA|nr:hypothetical protein [Bos mutus]
MPAGFENVHLTQLYKEYSNFQRNIVSSIYTINKPSFKVQTTAEPGASVMYLQSWRWFRGQLQRPTHRVHLSVGHTRDPKQMTFCDAGDTDPWKDKPPDARPNSHIRPSNQQYEHHPRRPSPASALSKSPTEVQPDKAVRAGAPSTVLPAGSAFQTQALDRDPGGDMQGVTWGALLFRDVHSGKYGHLLGEKKSSNLIANIHIANYPLEDIQPVSSSDIILGMPRFLPFPQSHKPPLIPNHSWFLKPNRLFPFYAAMVYDARHLFRV